MSPHSAGLEFRFLFDEHMNARAARQLRSSGIDVAHLRDVGLSGADDDVLFEWARKNARILVTRNYQDFAPLFEHAGREGIAIPGVLFYSSSISQSDPGAHVRALEAWISVARSTRRNPIENTFGWISPP